MDTVDSLMRRGYRLYKIDMRLTSSIRDYFRNHMGLIVEYHEALKVITVRDAKSES